MPTKTTIITFLLGLIVPSVICIILYFAIWKKKMCEDGDPYNCPSLGTKICPKSGVDNSIIQNLCNQKESYRKSGLKQNNPIIIANDMSSYLCPNYVSPTSDAVKCVLALDDIENKYTEPPVYGIFGDAGTTDDDMDQDRWCLGLPTSVPPDPSYDKYMKDVKRSSCSATQQTASPRKLRQDSPGEISRNMSQLCGGQPISEHSPAVKCAVALSEWETKELQGGHIFGKTTGIGDDFNQDRWCLGLDLDPTYPKLLGLDIPSSYNGVSTAQGSGSCSSDPSPPSPPPPSRWEQIAGDMSDICGQTVDKYAHAVNCAINLSDYESKIGKPLFGTKIGSCNDIVSQYKWCLNQGGTPNVDIKEFESYQGRCKGP